MKRRKITKSIAFLLGLFLLLLPLTAGEDNPIELPWYDVEEWEVAVCAQKTAEFEATGDDYEEGEGFQLDLFSNEIIATLQAERTDTTNNVSIVEIAWYVQPVRSAVNYEVEIEFEGGGTEVLESGSSTIASGYSGYQVIQETEETKIEEATLTVQEGEIEIKAEIA